MVAEHWVNNMI